MSQTSSLLLLLPIAIMMAKVMTIIMVLMLMIMITIKIMNVEYIWRISLNAMQINASSAVTYDFNQLIHIFVNAVPHHTTLYGSFSQETFSNSCAVA